MTVRRRRRKKRSKALPIILAVIASLAIFTCAYGLTSGWWFPDLFGGPTDSGDDPGKGGETPARIEGFNVLLLGTDDREAGDNYSRTDTMIVLNYNDEANRMSLLSIPRDTRVRIPGYGLDKINAANVYGGPELAVKTVSEFIDVPIEYYILTNFYGFKDIVDALGGVTINVEEDMNHYERAYGGKFNINLKKGEQRLDGEKALQYVRYRGDAYGDISRTGRQLKFLQALAKETMQAKTITKLHKLIPEIYENVETNMGLPQLYKLANAGKNLESVDIVTQTLPGHFLNTAQGSFWAVDREQAKRVAAALFEEGKVIKEVVQGPTEDLRPQPEKQDNEVILSQNGGRAGNKPAAASENQAPGAGAGQGQPAGETSPEPEPVNDSSGQGNSGMGNNNGQSSPAGEGTQTPADESTPPEGLPPEQPYTSGNNQVEIIIDIDNS